MKVLIIEDNEILSRNLFRYLSSREIFSEIALTGDDGLNKALKNNYDIIILDINLPGIDGREICKRIREKGIQVGIIMLTSNGRGDDIVEGLDLGADDYLVKPFEYSELIARINAVYRRNLPNRTSTIINHDNLSIDIQNILVKKDSEEVKLSKLEFELLKYLLQNKGKALSRQDIYEHVWGEYDGDFMFSKTIDVYVGYLRKKLGKDLIETKKGYGFMIS